MLLAGASFLPLLTFFLIDIRRFDPPLTVEGQKQVINLHSRCVNTYTGKPCRTRALRGNADEAHRLSRFHSTV